MIAYYFVQIYRSYEPQRSFSLFFILILFFQNFCVEPETGRYRESGLANHYKHLELNIMSIKNTKLRLNIQIYYILETFNKKMLINFSTYALLLKPFTLYHKIL